MERVDLNRLAHDLMNPLTVVFGYVQLLAERNDLPPDVTQALEAVLAQSREGIEIARQLKEEIKAQLKTASRPVCLIYDQEPVQTQNVVDQLQDNFICITVTNVQGALQVLKDGPIDRLVVTGVTKIEDLAKLVFELSKYQPDLPLKTIIVTDLSSVKEHLSKEGWKVYDASSGKPL